jgi:regulator of nucleoside diphosphate kinase
MRDDTRSQLTAKDISVLEGMMDRLEAQAQAQAAIKRLLRRKLATARICFSDDIDPRVATINSRVEFRIGSGSAETRVLTHGGESALRGAALPISSLHGLALLGLMEGDAITVETADGRTDVLSIIRVVHQPEAARLRNERVGLRLIDGAQARGRRTEDVREGPEDDDPGPSAA